MIDRRTFVTGAVAGALVAPPAFARAATRSLDGAFALLSGTRETSARATIGEGSFSVAFFGSQSTTPIRDFAITSEKPLHLLVLTPDLARLTHVHPVLGNDGIFRINDPAIRSSSVIYADAQPHGATRQVFRFGTPRRVVRAASPALASAGGGYRVRFPSVLPRRGGTLAFTVLRGEKPATDLRPYLGEQAHLVVLDLTTYAYVHAHPGEMAMSEMHEMGGAEMMMHDHDLPANHPVDPQMEVTLPSLAAGPVRIFVQFGTSSGAVHTATAVFA